MFHEFITLRFTRLDEKVHKAYVEHFYYKLYYQELHFCN